MTWMRPCLQPVDVCGCWRWTAACLIRGGLFYHCFSFLSCPCGGTSGANWLSLLHEECSVSAQLFGLTSHFWWPVSSAEYLQKTDIYWTMVCSSKCLPTLTKIFLVNSLITKVEALTKKQKVCHDVKVQKVHRWTVTMDDASPGVYPHEQHLLQAFLFLHWFILLATAALTNWLTLASTRHFSVCF